MLLERERFPRFKIGESLMPETYSTLDRLGMLDRLRESGSVVVKASVQFIAASGKASKPFYFFEHKDEESAYTWQVERSWFDEALVDNAATHGVDVRMATTATQVLFDGDRARGVKLTREDETEGELHARVVVDATGLASLVSRQLSLREPNPELNRAAVFAHYRNGQRSEGVDEGATLVVHTPDSQGWFWYIPLSDNRVSVGIVAPPSKLFGDGATSEDVLDAALAECAPMRSRLSEAQRIGPVRVAKDYSYRARQLAGDGWVLAGDAFSFLDPIYSSGVFLALKSGEMTADSVSAALAADDLSAARLGAFGDRLDEGVTAISRLVYAFYTPGFSFSGFLRAYPDHRRPLIDLLIGDVFDRSFDGMFTDLDAYLATCTPELATQA